MQACDWGRLSSGINRVCVPPSLCSTFLSFASFTREGGKRGVVVVEGACIVFRLTAFLLVYVSSTRLSAVVVYFVLLFQGVVLKADGVLYVYFLNSSVCRSPTPAAVKRQRLR